jgi:LCP family protein required for cell wall assembly
MSVTSDITESDPPEVEAAEPSPGRFPEGQIARVVVWTLIALLVGAIAVAAVVWRSLESIPTVPLEVDSARGRLQGVSAEDLLEQQAIAAQLEADTVAAEAADAEEALLADPDPIEGVRAALEGRDVNDLDIEFAHGTPVPDGDHDTYLLIGSDLSEALADVIIYVLLPRDGSDPLLASLPRDLYLPNPCTQQNSRLNAALNGCGVFANGPELLSLMVEDYTGIKVDHFAIVNFEGFTEVIDAFGGLEICVEHAVRDRKSFLSLPAGCTQADGETVLQWVRSRRTQELVDGEWRLQEGVDDFVRQDRQQQVLLDIAGKLGSFSSITAFSRVLAGLANSLTFDDSLNVPAMAQTAWELRGIDLDTVQRVKPGTEGYRTDHQAYVQLPTETFTDALANVQVEVDTTEAS